MRRGPGGASRLLEDGAAAPARGRRQRRRWESNPLRPGCSRSPGRLAPASFLDRCHVLARSRTWPPTFAGSCALRHTPRTSAALTRSDPPPGSRTRPCGFERRRASATPAGSQVPSPGVEPGLRPSEGRVPPSHPEDKTSGARISKNLCSLYGSHFSHGLPHFSVNSHRFGAFSVHAGHKKTRPSRACEAVARCVVFRRSGVGIPSVDPLGFASLA